MIDEQSSASGHDYASDRSAIGAGPFGPGQIQCTRTGNAQVVLIVIRDCPVSSKNRSNWTASMYRFILKLELFKIC